jgi:hypothetical protein
MRSFIHLMNYPCSVVIGFDNLMNRNIAHLLKHDDNFRAKISDLVMGESVAIPIQEISYHPLVASSFFMFP